MWDRIEESDADLIIVYSTWPSNRHQFQANPNLRTTLTMTSTIWGMPIRSPWMQNSLHPASKAESRGLQARTVNYDAFPIDTGSITALSLLNPDNRLPATIVSSNMYANRSETIVLGKAIRDALTEGGRKAVVVVVSSLSNRMFTEPIDPSEDRIHSQKDDDWNRKILEFFNDGRLEDLSQLSREIHGRSVQKVVAYKPAWWMAATVGQHNSYSGEILAYTRHSMDPVEL